LGLTRRADQTEQDRFPGVHRKTLTGIETGSRTLMVGDLIFDPGAEVPYHRHPNAEETQFLVEGELDCLIDGYRFVMVAGEAVLAPAGVDHGFVNRGDRPARMITMFPDVAPRIAFAPTPSRRKGTAPKGVRRLADLEPFEQFPGVVRTDFAGSAQGAVATTFSRLEFVARSTTPPHFHPATEESMFCLEGELTALYGRSTHRLCEGDMFTAEPGVRHGVFSESNRPATLLAMHPTTAPVRVLVDDVPPS